MSMVVPIDPLNVAYSVGPYYLYSYDEWGVKTTLPHLEWRYSSSRCALTEGDLWIARHGGSFDGTFYPYRITARDKTGVTQWEHVFTSDFYMGMGFEIRSDGTFITCGELNSPGPYDSWLIGLSSDGSTELFTVNTPGTGNLIHCVVDNNDVTYCAGYRKQSGVSNYTGIVRAYDINGVFKWEYVIATVFDSSAVYPSEPMCIGEDGKLYFGTMGNSLPFYALNSDGSLAWTKAIGSPCYCVGIAEDNTIYARDGTTLYALDPDDGATIWSAAIPSINRSIIDGNGKLLVCTAVHPREAICLKSDGTELWRFTFPAQYTTDTNYGHAVQPVIGTNHTLFCYCYESLFNSAYGHSPTTKCIIVKRGGIRRVFNSEPLVEGDKATVITCGNKRWVLKSAPILPGKEVRRIKIGKKSVLYRNTPSAWTPPLYTD